jgi:hypothetical protein
VTFRRGIFILFNLFIYFTPFPFWVYVSRAGVVKKGLVNAEAGLK